MMSWPRSWILRAGGCRTARPTGAGLPPVGVARPSPLRRVRYLRGLVGGELESHGSAHALASTARALRREATVLRDALRVQEELLRRRDEQGTATIAALSEILGRAGNRARAAVDHLHGEARRLRGRLDETHEKAVAGALAASAQILAELSERHGDGSPEDLESVRSTVADATRVRAQDWFAAADLDTAMRQAAVRAMESPRAELAQARWSTGELLQVELSDVVDLPGVEPPRTPSFEASVHPGWEELVSAAVKRRLPARLRRRQVLRELEGWRQTAVPRPFGRARSTLQDSLREADRAAERSIEATRTEHIAALQQGVAAAQHERGRSGAAIVSALAYFAQRFSTLDKVLTLLASR